MSKKKSKDKKSRPLPKSNQQIPNSMIRPLTGMVQSSVLAQSRQFPFHGCWVMKDWQGKGIAPVVVARLQEADKIMFAVYMVDLHCLGIKDVLTKTDYSLSRFERDLSKFCVGDPEPCSVELAHEIVYGAMEYAEKLGFQPHPDFKKQMADLMLDPPDAHPRDNQVSFGLNGKPLYVAGPYDDKFKSRSVINTLLRTCGEGNFDYIVGIDDI